MKHGILAKWNANSDSTAKVMLIKDGQLALIAHKKQMLNNNLILKATKPFVTSSKFQCKCSNESPTSANEVALQVFVH